MTKHRLITVLGLFLLALTPIGGCDKKPSSSASPSDGTAKANTATQPAAAGAAVTPRKLLTTPIAPQDTPSKPGAAQAKDPSAPTSAPNPVEAAPAAKPRETAKVTQVPAKVSETACKAACDNVLRLSLADLGTAKKEPKGELDNAAMAMIKARVKTDCPLQCRKHGNAASVSCLAKAKSALELAECPQ